MKSGINSKFNSPLFDIALDCAKSRKLGLGDMRSIRRNRTLSDARAEFAYRALAAGATFKAMGRFLRKDHSAMIYAWKRWYKKLQIEANK